MNAMATDKALSFFATWQKYREYLLGAIEYTYGTHTEDDVLLMIIAGRLRIWTGEKSALVTEFQEYPQMKVLNVFIGGGDLDELRDMEKNLIPFARANGCKRITGTGRLGWTKTLPGYAPGGYFMYKDI